MKSTTIGSQKMSLLQPTSESQVWIYMSECPFDLKHLHTHL